MIAPRVVAPPPPGWVKADDIARPRLAPAAEATFTSWEASRAPDRGGALVAGCVAAPISGWVEEMRPAIEARAVALVGAAAERVATVPVEPQAAGDRLVLRAVGAPRGSPVLGAARWWLGFSDDSRVVTCFAACASTSPARSATAECEAALAGVRFEPGVAPPEAGVVLGTLRWGIRHPGPTAAVGGALVTCAALLAVACRRKPRARIHGRS